MFYLLYGTKMKLPRNDKKAEIISENPHHKHRLEKPDGATLHAQVANS
jgi:hypothetical protein